MRAAQDEANEYYSEDGMQVERKLAVPCASTRVGNDERLTR